MQSREAMLEVMARRRIDANRNDVAPPTSVGKKLEQMKQWRADGLLSDR